MWIRTCLMSAKGPWKYWSSASSVTVTTSVTAFAAFTVADVDVDGGTASATLPPLVERSKDGRAREDMERRRESRSADTGECGAFAPLPPPPAPPLLPDGVRNSGGGGGKFALLSAVFSLAAFGWAVWLYSSRTMNNTRRAMLPMVNSDGAVAWTSRATARTAARRWYVDWNLHVPTIVRSNSTMPFAHTCAPCSCFRVKATQISFNCDATVGQWANHFNRSADVRNSSMVAAN